MLTLTHRSGGHSLFLQGSVSPLSLPPGECLALP